MMNFWLMRKTVRTTMRQTRRTTMWQTMRNIMRSNMANRFMWNIVIARCGIRIDRSCIAGSTVTVMW